MTDISKTLEAKSDQMNACDLAEPITVKVVKVTVTDPLGEQPVHVFMEGEQHKGKPYKPCKLMRRLLARLWGADASVWIGRSMTLYCDPTVKWAGEEVGGLRISHLSHIQGKQEVVLLSGRGKFQKFTIHPLADAPKPKAATPKQYAAFLERMAKVNLDEASLVALCKERSWNAELAGWPAESLSKLAETLEKELNPEQEVK